MKIVLCGSFAFGCADASPGNETNPGPATQTREPLYYEEDAVWDFREISVCFDTDEHEVARGWIRDAVENAFEPLSDVNFTEWEECGSADVVVDLSNDNWPAAFLGGVGWPWLPSVFLNPFSGRARDLDGNGDLDAADCYAFRANGTDNPDSSAKGVGETGREWPTHRQRCVEVTAVHEFAHLLGVAHEQNRPDKPGWCNELDTDSGDTTYGYWDVTSVSNYCNPAWDNDGRLSPLDVSWLIDFYGKDTNDFLWTSLGNARDYGAGTTRPPGDDQMNFAIEARDIVGDFVPQAGDFNGDGRSDILWYREGTGNDYVWYATSDGGFDKRETESSIDSTYRMVTADFDGDDKTDVFMHAPGDVNDRVWFGRGNETFDSVVLSNITGTFKPIAGDFDGDGRGDVFLYRPGSSTDYVWWGRSDRTFEKEEAQENVTGSYVPLAGDFDGDGKTDIFWYFPGGSEDERIWWGRGIRTFVTTSNIPNVSKTYSPSVGDYDGNGVSDILWSDGSESARDPMWLFKTTRGAFSASHVSHVLNSEPFSGDFNGDGLDDVFFYKADDN